MPKPNHPLDIINSPVPGQGATLDRQPAHTPRVMGFFDVVLFYVVTGISLRWIATAAAARAQFDRYLVRHLAPVLYPARALGHRAVVALPARRRALRVDQARLRNFAGFMSAWVYWTSNLPYFPAVLYFAASNAIFMREERWRFLSNSAWFYVAFSIAALAIVTIMNVVGLDVGKWLHNVGALAMWVPVMIVIIMGIVAWRRFGTATPFTAATLLPSLRWKDMIFWSTLTFAFGGCETASFMGEEIKNPRRTIPLALFTGGLVVTFCYIVGTVCVLLAMPHEQVSDLQGLMQAITVTGHRIGFMGVVPLAAALIALSNLGSAGAYLAAVARLPFVAGIDRFLPESFGRLHPRFRTPYVALILQSMCGVLFIFLGQAGTSVKGAYDVLVSIGVITYFIPYLFSSRP